MNTAIQPTMPSWWMSKDSSGPLLEQRNVTIPIPGEGQLLVRLRAAGLNRGELLAVSASASVSTPWKALGSEAAGEVMAIGPKVTGFTLGMRVMGRCNGAFAHWALMQASEAIAIPERLSWTEAAAVPLTFLVAHDMLVLQGQLRAGQWVLINGVSSGVGVACLQLAKALGARVIGSSGSVDKLRALSDLGLDHGLAGRKDEYAGQVMAWTGQHGAHVIVNTVGGTLLSENVKAAAFEATLAIVGHVDGVLRAELDLEALHSKRLRIVGVSNKLRTQAQRAAVIPAFVRDVIPLLADGRITPLIDSTYPFDQLPAAIHKMQTSGHVGKIVLSVHNP